MAGSGAEGSGFWKPLNPKPRRPESLSPLGPRLPKRHWDHFRRQRAGEFGNGAHTGALLGTLGLRAFAYHRLQARGFGFLASGLFGGAPRALVLQISFQHSRIWGHLV